tara:strand:+ start:216 stop:1508 length:1293 start_codon:yes stop_codon:yes gene_type:complete
MAINVTLTSYVLSPWDGSYHGGGTNLIALSYADLDFTPSAADSYKSTSGDIFKVYVGGKRIYRRSDQTYASGSGFLEDGDASSGATLNGKTGSVNGNTVSWDSTTDAVWTIDTANRLILISKSAVADTDLYGSGTSALNIAFTGSSTIITLTRAVQDLKSPAIDFSNASILTEQDLDNSAKNVFHASQQAIISTENALLYSEGTDAYSAAQPGTSNPKKIQNVLAGTASTDAVNFGQIAANLTSTTAEKELAAGHRRTADDYAVKINGVVNTYTDTSGSGSATTDHSSKAWAVGGTGVTTTSAKGAAKEWATTVGGYVDTAEYSAKEYAQGTTVATGSSKIWASKDTTAVASGLYSAKEYASGTAEGSGGSAKAWAIDTSSPDGSSEKSAKTLAGEASTSATNASNSASAAATSASNASSSSIVFAIALG